VVKHTYIYKAGFLGMFQLPTIIFMFIMIRYFLGAYSDHAWTLKRCSTFFRIYRVIC